MRENMCFWNLLKPPKERNVERRKIEEIEENERR
jgi:hypothetical protein